MFQLNAPVVAFLISDFLLLQVGTLTAPYLDDMVGAGKAAASEGMQVTL